MLALQLMQTAGESGSLFVDELCTLRHHPQWSYFVAWLGLDGDTTGRVVPYFDKQHQSQISLDELIVAMEDWLLSSKGTKYGVGNAVQEQESGIRM